jgi:hypothetical protein
MMQWKFWLLGAVLILLVGCSESLAEVKNVPSAYPTIQAAIDAAVDGDTVIVADGTYTGPGNRDISLHGKAITVASANGPANCIIDCQNLGRGFFIFQGEGPDTVLSGFTIINGYATHGGGIYIHPLPSTPVVWTSPTISNCIVRNNRATTYGGGIACKGGRPLISGCIVRSNSAPNSGGVHFQDGSRALLTGCTISNNTATAIAGGGIGSYSSAPGFSGCSITMNISAQGGGGAYLENSPATLYNCLVEGNQTGVTGGGLSLNGSDAAINYTDILANRTTSAVEASSGGGIFLADSKASILACDISNNEANINFVDAVQLTNSGGISFHQGSDAVMRNCTVTNNKAQERGGVGSWNSAPQIESCEITANQATAGGGGGVGFYGNANAPLAEPSLSYSTISGNYAFETGGGIAVWQRSPVIIGCLVDGNLADISSGGINLYGTTQTQGSTARTRIADTIVSNNSSASRGGIYIRNIGTGSVSIVNTLITGNTSNGLGGGLACYFAGHATLTNCTISGNRAAGSGALIVDSSDVAAANSIFWGNSPSMPAKSGSGALTITYSDVEGGYAGTGNINIPPDFAGVGDYHLNPGSPCLDAGSNSAAGIPAYDLDRNKRLIDADGNGFARVDMGVYEYGTYFPKPFPWILLYNVLIRR